MKDSVTKFCKLRDIFFTTFLIDEWFITIHTRDEFSKPFVSLTNIYKKVDFVSKHGSWVISVEESFITSLNDRGLLHLSLYQPGYLDVEQTNKSDPVSDDEFRRICSDMAELYRREKLCCGDVFHKSYKDFGLVMPVIRMRDAIERLKTL